MSKAHSVPFSDLSVLFIVFNSLQKIQNKIIEKLVSAFQKKLFFLILFLDEPI